MDRDVSSALGEFFSGQRKLNQLGIIHSRDYIGDIGSVGHSFEVVVDPDDSEYRKAFGFDGDGADHIASVELDGQKVRVS